MTASHALSDTGRAIPVSRAEQRALLEEQWRHHVAEIIRLSLQLCDVQASGGDDGGQLERLRTATRLIASQRQLLADIEAALTRLDAGRYGVCEQCTNVIPTGRLEVLPQTRYCVGCQPRRSAKPARTARSGVSAG